MDKRKMEEMNEEDFNLGERKKIKASKRGFMGWLTGLEPATLRTTI